MVDPTSYYFRTAPLFETSAAKYDWINRVVAVGIGHRRPDGAIYSVFEVPHEAGSLDKILGAIAALLKGWFGKLFGSSVASMLCLCLSGNACCLRGHVFAADATFQPAICTALFATDHYITQKEDAGKVALFRS